MGRTGAQWTEEQRVAHAEKQRAKWTPEMKEEARNRAKEAWTPQRRAAFSEYLKGNKRRLGLDDPAAPSGYATEKNVFHGTQAECEFISRLGWWAGKVTRPVLLMRYLDAMALRVNWGGIDLEAVRAHVRRQIETGA